MRLTFSISAVPLLKGNILIGIVRNMPASTTTTFSTVALQKINWAILNLNGAGDYSFDIGDARQSDFFRNVADDPEGADPADLQERPGIIAVIYTTISNQFGGDADTSVIINVRSQAISPAEDAITGFYCYEPLDFSTSTATSKDQAPLVVRLADALPRLEGRSLYLDGTKIVNNDYLDLSNAATSAFRFTGQARPASATNAKMQPYFFAEDVTSNPRKIQALITTNTIDPNYCQWQDAALAGYGTSVDLRNLVNSGRAGNWLVNNSSNHYLGYTTSTVPVPVNDINLGTVTEVQLIEVTTLVYQRGYIIIWVFEADAVTMAQPDFISRTITDAFPILERQVRAVTAGFPTSDYTLPSSYYNVVLATDGQVAPQNPIQSLPILFDDKSFVSTFYKLSQQYFPGGDRIFCMDLVDYRDGSLVGTLALLGSQVVLRTEVPVTGRSHYRISIDIRFLTLQNPRQAPTVPNSLSSPFLQLFEPASVSATFLLSTRLASLKKAKNGNDSISMDELINALTGDDITPNAEAFAFAGGLAGLGSGYFSYLQAKMANDQALLMQKNKYGIDSALMSQQFRQNLEFAKYRTDAAQQMKGLGVFMGVPGSMENAFAQSNAAPNTPRTAGTGLSAPAISSAGPQALPSRVSQAMVHVPTCSFDMHNMTPD